MTHTRKQLPKYCLHKATGRAYVRIDGKMYYMGKYGSAASRREYDRIIGEFVANGRQTLYIPGEVLVETLVCRFLDHMERNLKYAKGTKERIVVLLRLVNELYGKQPVAQFGTAALKAIRQQFIDKNLCRNTINNYIGDIQRVFEWGCEEEIIPAEIGGILRAVRPLKQGRTSAPDYDPVETVDDSVVEKTLQYLRPTYQDMVKVQRLIGGRPQDVLNMRFCDIDRSRDIWKYTPFTHKTKYKDKIRMLPVGPKAQQILLPYFNADNGTKQFVFVTAKGQPYRHEAYATAISRACKKAGVPRWTPNQLRHTAGTEIRDKFGIEYAQAALGHASIKTTEIYAQVNYEKAEKVAREIG
jgi:integrase